MKVFVRGRFSFNFFKSVKLSPNACFVDIGVNGEAIKKHKPAILCEILDSHSDENIPGMQAKADKLVAFITSLDYRILRIVHENGKITPEEISEVKLKKWTPQSWNLNDYLLIPKHVAYTDIVQA